MSDPTPQQNGQSPSEFLATIPGAPSAARIQEWKNEVPGNRVRLFATPPDGKYVFILRALSGVEMNLLAAEISRKAESGSNPEQLLASAGACKACLWTNFTRDGVLDETAFLHGPAGLPMSLYTLVSELSGFYDPMRLEQMSADL